MSGAQSRIVVLLDPARTALSGVVRADAAADQPFSGWLGLLSALQTAVEALAAAPGGEATEEEIPADRRQVGEEGSNAAAD